MKKKSEHAPPSARKLIFDKQDNKYFNYVNILCIFTVKSQNENRINSMACYVICLVRETRVYGLTSNDFQITHQRTTTGVFNR